MTDQEFIRNKVGSEMYAQLAEECMELAKECLKMRRAMDGVNPTPVTVNDCFENIMEEYNDILLCCEVIGIPVNKTQIEMKTKRWISRLEVK